MRNNDYVVKMMPGCVVASTSAGEIMFGCPADVLKVFARTGKAVPEAIVLPDQFYQFGVNQAALEFILYNFLYVMGRFAQGGKLAIIGRASQCERMRQILDLTVNGLTEAKMESFGIDQETIDRAVRLRNYFGIKKPGTQELATINDMVNFFVFNKDEAVVDEDVTIKIMSDGIYKVLDFHDVTETLVDINISEQAEPPLPIGVPEKLPPRMVFGATALSKCTTGFDHNGYTSGLVLWINNLGVSVDGVSWMKEHLQALGISPKEIKAHIITHLHDDHSNIYDLIVNGQRFYLISDKLIYHSLVRKVSLMLDIAPAEVKEYIVLIEVTPGQPLHWYGAKFEFWPTAHPIPTLGFRVCLGDQAIVYSGDTVWGRKLKEMYGQNVINQQMYNTIQNVPCLQSNLTFHDAGGGMIHPDLSELNELPDIVTDEIMPTHLASIPPHLTNRFSLIYPGQTWVLTGNRSLDVGDVLRIFSSPAVEILSSMWQSVIISQATIEDYQRGQVVLEQGSPGKAFFIIISGTVSVVADKKEIAELSTGDFFGEYSIRHDVPCTATIIAKTPVKIALISRDIFLEIVSKTAFGQILSRIHRFRPLLLEFAFVKGLPPEKVNLLAASSKRAQFKSGKKILSQGQVADYFYMISKGQVAVTVNGGSQPEQRIAVLTAGQCFGEMALLSGEKRNANVVALSDVEVLAISCQNFKKIVGSTPMLRYCFGKLAEARKIK